MAVQWEDKENGLSSVARPAPDITIHALRWSKLWAWVILTKGDTVTLARGSARDCEKAKKAAEHAWHQIKGVLDHEHEV